MNSEQGDDTPLKYLVDALLRYRAVAAILFGGCILIGILYLQIAPRSYTVSMAVTSASQNSVQSPLSNGLQLLGVAPISDQVTLFAEYLEGLHSTETASALLRNQPLMRRIFASEWSDTKGWTEPSSLAKSVKKLSSPRWDFRRNNGRRQTRVVLRIFWEAVLLWIAT